MTIRNRQAGTGFAFVLLAACLPAICLGDAAIRPDNLVFSETLTLGEASSATWPLYLTRRGEYYVEVTLERDAARAPRPEAREIDMALTIRRRDRELLHRERATILGESRPAQTLVWFTSDREIPIKAPLELTLALAAPAAQGEALRVQVRRKRMRGRSR